ncbi:STAS domain-containing protein [Streptacidiphilus sp. PAMC 29251]
MPARRLFDVRRYDTITSALIVLVGDIDLDTAPLLHDALEARLHDGVRTVTVDLAGVTFCDLSGIDAFLGASQHAAAAGVSLCLYDPRPALGKLLDLTGSDFLLRCTPLGDLRPPVLFDLARGFPSQAYCVCCEAKRQSTQPPAETETESATATAPQDDLSRRT